VAILKEYWERGGVSAIGVTEQPSTWRVEYYAPWRWLFPVATVRQLIMAVGFDVLEDRLYWGGKAHSFLARERILKRQSGLLTRTYNAQFFKNEF